MEEGFMESEWEERGGGGEEVEGKLLGNVIRKGGGGEGGD